jgi:hypothetical protein
MSRTLTKEEFKLALPANVKGNVSQDLVDQVNLLLTAPELQDTLVDNLISYSSVMKDGKYKLVDYVNAVRFVSFVSCNNTNKEAYIKTFPNRYAKHMQNKVNAKDLSAYVSSYRHTKLVTSILAQSLIPIYISNANNLQEAINIQMEIARDIEVSAKVRSDAANSIMTHLKAPETSKIELDIVVKETNVISDLTAVMAKFAEAQQQAIIMGTSTVKEIAHSGIIIDHEPTY